MARTIWLLKGREDSAWPLQAFTSYEAAHAQSALMHGDLGDESAFVQPVNLYGVADVEAIVGEARRG